MTGRVGRGVLVACLALAFVALSFGVAAAQSADGPDGENATGNVSALANESMAANAELERASARADRRLAHVGGGVALGLGIGLVVGSVVSFQIWRARVR